MRKPITYACISVISLFVFGCGADNNGDTGARSMEQLHAEQGVPVKTEVVVTENFDTAFSYHSVLTGIEETKATAMVSDRVETIHYAVGDRVSRDAVVVTFPTDNPQAQYYQSKVAFEHAQTTLGRMHNLYENGGISLQEYENAETQFEVSKANWESVRQTVTVEAPISGVLTNIAVRESDNVNPGDVLFTISKTEKLKTRVWASERQIADIRAGNMATASWQNMTLHGSVVQVDMSLDNDKQAFGVVVEFDNPGSRVMSGVNAEITIHGTGIGNAILTARKNIVNEGDSYVVFLADNATAVKREVRLGRNNGIDVEIIEGLIPGDTLITEGQLLLDNNMKINIIE